MKGLFIALLILFSFCWIFYPDSLKKSNISRTKIGVSAIILLFVVFVIDIYAVVQPKRSVILNKPERNTPMENASNTTEETTYSVNESGVISTLTHEDLLAIVNNDYRKVLGNTYSMTLYLEQASTSTQAEFMTQPDDNSMETILVTCNMPDVDLLSLDDISAQQRIYKPYEVRVTFRKYDTAVGFYYTADCFLN